MKFKLLTALVVSLTTLTNSSFAEQTLVEFTVASRFGFWLPLTDQIRGGKSTIEMQIENDQSASIFGNLTLMNGAGFASYRVTPTETKFWNLANESELLVESSGDGRTYKVLLKDQVAADSIQDYSWEAELVTTSQLRTESIPLLQFKPYYRGRVLENIQPLDQKKIVQIGIQLNDKQPGPFLIRLRSIKAR